MQMKATRKVTNTDNLVCLSLHITCIRGWTGIDLGKTGKEKKTFQKHVQYCIV